MKVFLLIVLFGIFVVISFLIYRYYLIRFYLFFDLEFMCKYFKNNISFFKDNVTNIISSLKDKLHLSTKRIIKNLDKNIYYIKKDDKQIIIKFIYSLGNGDVDYEINNINYYENYFLNIKNESKDDVKNKGILYMKLLIILGLTLVVLFI